MPLEVGVTKVAAADSGTEGRVDFVAQDVVETLDFARGYRKVWANEPVRDLWLKLSWVARKVAGYQG